MTYPVCGDLGPLAGDCHNIKYHHHAPGAPGLTTSSVASVSSAQMIIHMQEKTKKNTLHKILFALT